MGAEEFTPLLIFVCIRSQHKYVTALSVTRASTDIHSLTRGSIHLHLYRRFTNPHFVLWVLDQLMLSPNGSSVYACSYFFILFCVTTSYLRYHAGEGAITP